MVSKAKTQIAVLFLAVLSLALVSYSQPISCELNIKIFDNDTSGTLTKVNIRFTEFDTKQIHKEKVTPDSLMFNNLNSGIYQIELNKKGYKRKIKKFSVDCSLVDSSNTIFENIYLWKGNNKDLIKLDTTDFNIAFAISQSDKSATGVAFESQDKIINGKFSNGKAVNLVHPVYPPAARAVRASGQVNVQVTIDEDGNVIQAKAIDGHFLLQGAAIKAVKLSKFSPTLLEGNPVKIMGVIVYNFTAQ